MVPLLLTHLTLVMVRGARPALPRLQRVPDQVHPGGAVPNDRRAHPPLELELLARALPQLDLKDNIPVAGTNHRRGERIYP
eukprot:1177809-Prorocentrum_minimum.AAC.1